MADGREADMPKSNDELEKLIKGLDKTLKKTLKKVDKERYDGDAALKRQIQKTAEDVKRIKKHFGIK
jgi:predicted phage-related endonuclease